MYVVTTPPATFEVIDLDASQNGKVARNEMPELEEGQVLIWYQPAGADTQVTVVQSEKDIKAITDQGVAGVWAITDEEAFVSPKKVKAKALASKAAHKFEPIVEGLMGGFAAFSLTLTLSLGSEKVETWEELIAKFPGNLGAALTAGLLVGYSKYAVERDYVAREADRQEGFEEDEDVPRLTDPDEIRSALRWFRLDQIKVGLAASADTFDRAFLIDTLAQTASEKMGEFLKIDDEGVKELLRYAIDVIGFMTISGPAGVKKFLSDGLRALNREAKEKGIPSEMVNKLPKVVECCFVPYCRFVLYSYPRIQALTHVGAGISGSGMLAKWAGGGSVAQHVAMGVAVVLMGPTLGWTEKRYQDRWDVAMAFGNLQALKGEAAAPDKKVTKEELERLYQGAQAFIKDSPVGYGIARGVIDVMTLGTAELVDLFDRNPGASTCGLGGGVKTLRAGQYIGHGFLIEESLRKAGGQVPGHLAALREWVARSPELSQLAKGGSDHGGFAPIGFTIGVVTALATIHAKKGVEASLSEGADDGYVAAPDGRRTLTLASLVMDPSHGVGGAAATGAPDV